MAPLWLLLGALHLLPLTLCTQVPVPEKVRVQALNTNYTLLWSWSWDQDSDPDGQTVSFTVQYKRNCRNSNWKPVCETSELFCDLNPLDLLYQGKYCLQVRASVDGLHSNWTGHVFFPAQDAAVGPPTRVMVSSAGNALEVFVIEPQTINNTSMKEKIGSLYFRVTFWEKERSDQRETVNSSQTLVTLKDLSSWTWYCVSVQSRTIDPNRTSAFTHPVCVRTEGALPWEKICLYFGTLLCFVFVLVLATVSGCFYSHRIFKNSCNPSVTRPVFLDDVHIYPELMLMLDCQSERQCDLLTLNSSSECQFDFLTVNSSSVQQQN